MRKRKAEKAKNEAEVKEPEPRFEPYGFVAYVSGPVFKYEVPATNFDNAYATGMRMLNNQLKEYGPRVRVEKIELMKFPEIDF